MLAELWIRELPKSNYTTVDLRTTQKVASADVGMESRRAHPGHGWCLRCGLSNTEVQMHDVQIDAHKSVAIACETCWAESDLDERIKLGRAMVRSWMVGGLAAAYSKHIRLDETDPDLVMVRRAIEHEHDTSCARHAAEAAARRAGRAARFEVVGTTN